MSKKKLKPDTVLKSYWNRNEEFADLFNAVLFGGKQVIQADELEERDSESSVVLQTDSYTDSIQATRDLFKVVMRTKEVEYVLLGLENQENVHYAMPLRDLEYNTYSYRRQYEKLKEKYPDRKGLKGNEFLSYMKKEDKLIPVITLVLYYGEEQWDGAKSLYEMLHLSEELKSFVNDYKMNLIEVRNAQLIFHNKNNRDLFQLFQLLYDETKTKEERRQSALQYDETHELDESVLMAVASTSKINLDTYKEKGGSAMCSLFEEIEKDGRIEGEKLGGAKQIVRIGLKIGWSETEILEQLQQNLEIPLEKAEEFLEKFKK